MATARWMRGWITKQTDPVTACWGISRRRPRKRQPQCARPPRPLQALVAAQRPHRQHDGAALGECRCPTVEPVHARLIQALVSARSAKRNARVVADDESDDDMAAAPPAGSDDNDDGAGAGAGDGDTDAAGVCFLWLLL